jgi:hypothetical protein
MFVCFFFLLRFHPKREKTVAKNIGPGARVVYTKSIRKLRDRARRTERKKKKKKNRACRNDAKPADVPCRFSVHIPPRDHIRFALHVLQ